MEISWRKELFEHYLYTCIEKRIKDKNWREQILYSIKAGGKRFRPALCYICGNALEIEKEQLYIIGCAIELLHTASLIHDDLPEIDNDDYRRGELSHHKRFNHGTAVIAGDYSFFLAFDLITSIENSDLSKYFVQCSKDLAFGEYLDIIMDNKKEVSEKKLLEMYEYKTARLIEFAMTAPSILEKKSLKHIRKIKNAGLNMGIAFQILDDLKGLQGSFEEIGKTPGKDIINNKKTIPSIIGLELSKKMVEEKKNICFSEVESIRDIDGTDYSSVINYLLLIWDKIVTV